MNEFEFIDCIKPESYQQPSILKGIGDDAAVFRTSDDIVTATDTFVENVHFSWQTMSPFQAGWRALAANVSDMAAMGANPVYYLVSIVVPIEKTKETLFEVYRGMRELASKFGVDLIGGDTVSGEELSLSITIIGFVDKDRALFRSNAQVDDVVFVSGTLGGARAGLEILLNGWSSVKSAPQFMKRHQTPMPQIELGQLLQQFDRVALNDISDGISNELQEIAVASDVTVIIDDAKIPVHSEFNQFSPAQQSNWKYFGGEDFELVGTVPKKDWDDLKKVAAHQAIRLTAIGSTVMNEKNEKPHVLIRRKGQTEPLFKKGYTHLK